MNLNKVEFEADGTKGPPNVTPCDLCIIRAARCDKHCEDEYYEISEEEPVKIPTEYEWVQERYELLKNSTGKFNSPNRIEFLQHEKWLKDNKPTIFVTCTRENTKVGDSVKVINSEVVRVIEHIFEKRGQTQSQVVKEYYDCVANNEAGTYPSTLAEYEIDLNNTEE